MERVELRPAHTWDCPECAAENFCRCIVVEMSQEDIEHYREKMDLDVSERGMWVTKPDEVTCSHCGREFETEDYGMGPEEIGDP